MNQAKFILSSESTIDMLYSYAERRDIPILFYSYTVDGVQHTDDMGRDPNALSQFYGYLNDGKLPSTSQLNLYEYIDFFEGLLKRNQDILHVVFGSGMTQSITNAVEAAEELKKKYPSRRIEVVDSMCSSSGFGMLVDYAADMRDTGASIDEVKSWLLAHRKKVHHQFFSTDLKYYRRSGRMSGAAAMLGAILDICPIMRLDDGGHIIAYGKVRGKRNAIKETVNTMEMHAEGGAEYGGKCFICNSNCLAEAEQLKAALEQRFPNIAGKIEIFDIGTIIASHCGPGTVAVFFMGNEREPYAQK